CVEKERLKKQHSRTLKSIDNLSLSAQRDRANKVARLEYQTFEKKCKTLYHPNDNPILRSIVYELSSQTWTINYNSRSQINNEQIKEV
ncbi:25062_t:CDS:1, partial [Cetraspora pellucida]